MPPSTRAEAQVAISRSSSRFLVLMITALLRLDAKHAAALIYAASRDDSPDTVARFIQRRGGFNKCADRMRRFRRRRHAPRGRWRCRPTEIGFSWNVAAA